LLQPRRRLLLLHVLHQYVQQAERPVRHRPGAGLRCPLIPRVLRVLLAAVLRRRGRVRLMAGDAVCCPVMCIVLMYRMRITYFYSLIGKSPLSISGSNKPSGFRIIRWTRDVIPATPYQLPASELKRNDDLSHRAGICQDPSCTCDWRPALL